MYTPVAKPIDFDSVETASLAMPRKFSPKLTTVFLDHVEGQMIIDGPVPGPPGGRKHGGHKVVDQVGRDTENVGGHTGIYPTRLKPCPKNIGFMPLARSETLPRTSDARTWLSPPRASQAVKFCCRFQDFAEPSRAQPDRQLGSNPRYPSLLGSETATHIRLKDRAGEAWRRHAPKIAALFRWRHVMDVERAEFWDRPLLRKPETAAHP